MPASDIEIRGAREHNLQNVDLVLPRNQLICLTGVSGSGKSSLAFDTLYAEGQRRYVESLSSFARHFLGQMPKPDVDFISGLSPSISISQKSTSKNPRSTVGTITEIYDYLRVLFARIGQGYCPKCGQMIAAQSREEILARILELEKGIKFSVLAPVIRQQKGEHKDLFEDLSKQGFVRARVDGVIVSLSDEHNLDRQRRHNIEVVVDRLEIKKGIRARLGESVELALKIGRGTLTIAIESEEAPEQEVPQEVLEQQAKKTKVKKKKKRDANDILFSTDYACGNCGLSFDPPTPQMFSFNSPQGMCETCDGIGELYSLDPDLLVTDPTKSFKQGCFDILGDWTALGRWKRHIYEGLCETVERTRSLPSGILLDTPWENLSEDLQEILLYGTGDLNITYTWQGGNSPMKYGGTFDGIIPELDAKYRGLKSRTKQRVFEEYMNNVACADCRGERLAKQPRHIRITTESPKFKDAPEKTLPQICRLSIDDAAEFFTGLELSPTQHAIAGEAVREIQNRLGFLLNVGLNYLALDRQAPTLSGGESQRIRLAGQIGSGLVGVLYILDEPSIGLHPRDNERLLGTLQHLRDMGNTVVVVEHDEDTMRAADFIIDFGPGPGVRGGEIVGIGSPDEVMKSKRSVTGKYLSGKLTIDIPEKRRERDEKSIRIIGAEHNNLKKIDIDIPIGKFVCVTGVSGSGKSSFVNDILVEALRRDLNNGLGEPGKHRSIEGVEHLDKMIAIDQSPIGRTPRSNPGTYIKVFDDIRNLFSQLSESKKRGFKPGRFSFNVKGGRCEACEGNGANKLEMDFLADVWVTCPVCEGKRFNRETLQVRFKEKTISEVLEMEIEQAIELFENIPKIHHKLMTLQSVGLDYLQIGQPSPTLSGGEAQRIKLARELVKKSTGKTLYLLDEPTTGLHFADIQLLLKVLQNFVEAGNTVLVVEHNLDVIKTADWVIDLGPEGGAGGGQIVAQGTPEVIAASSKSETGQALAVTMGLKPNKVVAKKTKKVGKKGKAEIATKITVAGASQHNLKHVDAVIERDKMTVFCGPSGSGKSSLAMDTIYAEGQRRYVESLSSYARQFVNQMQKPQLEHIDGLSPAIAIEQKNLGSTPRSTVGTVTEIYDYFRIMMSRLAVPYCPDCDRKIGTQTSDQIVDKIMRYEEGTRLFLMAPVDSEFVSDYQALFEEFRSNGYSRVRIDGQVFGIDDVPPLDRRRIYEIEIVVDRIVVQEASRRRIADSVELTLSIGSGVMHVAEPSADTIAKGEKVVKHSQHLACEECGRSFEKLSPHNFSFNSQLGWCRDCEGIGVQVGANPASLIRDSKLTLAQGAIQIWPNVSNKTFQLMLKAVSNETGMPLDVPFEELNSRWRRLIFHGTKDRWISVFSEDKEPKKLFEFQYKGLYPAIDEAAKLSPTFRAKLQKFVDEVECSSCDGSRLRDDSSAARFRDQTIGDLCRMPLGQLQKLVDSWKFQAREKKIAGEIIREIKNRLQFLNDVGLNYLTIGRTAASLSNGEAQRIRLASQLGSGLCGVLYVLDEPTIGLHPRDNTRLLGALHRLRDIGNTLLVVEHDKEVIASSDYIFDFGPKAGKHGGQVVAHAEPAKIGKKRGSVSGPYISDKKGILIPSNRRPAMLGSSEAKKKAPKKKSVLRESIASRKLQPVASKISIIGARHNNLKNVTLDIPLGTLTAVTGPSGCGKSSIINEVLYNELARRLHRAATNPGAHEKITGIEQINKVIRVDQTPLGNSPTSNPATYTGVFESIRLLFSQLPESKIRGYSARRFSFNVAGGRCEHCSGAGEICIEMYFLPDVWVPCDVCNGQRYNEETLAVKYHGHSINDVLRLSCGEGAKLFKNIPKIHRILQTLCDVGLDYVSLGQSAPTLSGGEAQRVKLAAELARPDTGRTLYLLDEPTTGLHFSDLEKLLDVLHRLVDLGNTVVLIEHNLDVIKSADWVIDMGPEAGAEGGRIVVAGTPEKVVEYAEAAKKPTKKKGAEKLMRSYTGEALAPVLAVGPYGKRKEFDQESAFDDSTQGMLIDIAKDAKVPWDVDGQQWHLVDRVDRNGEPVKWEGEVLKRVIDHLESTGEFGETNWNNRSVVEIPAKKAVIGWFFHAITAETWTLKMKFRVRRNTFRRDELVKMIPLKTLNQLDEVPVYSNEPRLKCKNLAGPWQEVELRIHKMEEIDKPGFWNFLDQAVAGFVQRNEPAEFNIEDHTPWKKLGKQWHLMKKGFPPRQSVEWDFDLLESLADKLEKISGEPFFWQNKQVVRIDIPGHNHPWVSLQTKKPECLVMFLNSPKNTVSLGEAVEFGSNRSMERSGDREILRIEFEKEEQIHKDALDEFLKAHFEAFGTT